MLGLDWILIYIYIYIVLPLMFIMHAKEVIFYFINKSPKWNKYFTQSKKWFSILKINLINETSIPDKDKQVINKLVANTKADYRAISHCI